jgi:crotonobetainyl-CoA:carnitine CoA-transferase CaiB-like acyl-CoA transferase
VIKFARPSAGDTDRQIHINDVFLDGDCLIFHTTNRNKDSFTTDLKEPVDRRKVIG